MWRRQIVRDAVDQVRFRMRGATDAAVNVLLERVLSGIKGHRVVDLRRMTPDVLAGILPRVYPQMLAVVREHQDSGRPCYIATAASQPAAEILAEALIMEGAMGTCWEVGAASTRAASTARLHMAKARRKPASVRGPAGHRPSAVVGVLRCSIRPADARDGRPPGGGEPGRRAGGGSPAGGMGGPAVREARRAAAGGSGCAVAAAVGGSGSWLAARRSRAPSAGGWADARVRGRTPPAWRTGFCRPVYRHRRPRRRRRSRPGRSPDRALTLQVQDDPGYHCIHAELFMLQREPVEGSAVWLHGADHRKV